MKTNGLPKVFLRSGQVYISRNPVKVTTILGSCLSVTMFNRMHSLGAICHALLPNDKGKGNYKYVDSSVKRMVREFVKYGIKPEEIEVKLFGGSELVFPEETNSPFIAVGKQNIFSAREIAELLNLKIEVSDVGGNQGRKIIFFTHTGEVYLKRLNKMERKDETILFLQDLV